MQSARSFRTRKVGHAGTLDPDATGVLVPRGGAGYAVAVLRAGGPQALPRGGDVRGVDHDPGLPRARSSKNDPPTIDRSDVEREAKVFVGDIEQVPPMVSAVKVGGERLYTKARRGEEVERPARPVTIYELHVIGIHGR